MSEPLAVNGPCELYESSNPFKEDAPCRRCFLPMLAHRCAHCGRGPEVSATFDWRGVCSISNRCLFAGCFYPLGDMCVFCFTVRPVAPLGRSPLELRS